MMPPESVTQVRGILFPTVKESQILFNRRLFFLPLLASRSGSYHIASSAILAGAIFSCKGIASCCPVVKYRCANGLRRLTAAFPNQRLTFRPPSFAGQGQTGYRCSCLVLRGGYSVKSPGCLLVLSVPYRYWSCM